MRIRSYLLVAIALCSAVQLLGAKDAKLLLPVPAVAQDAGAVVPKDVADSRMLAEPLERQPANASLELAEGVISNRPTIITGSSVAYIDLGDSFVLDRVVFLPIGGSGSFALSGAITLPSDPSAGRWQTLVERTSFRGDEPFVADFLPTQARFVRLEFDVRDHAALADFALFGEAKAAQALFPLLQYSANNAPTPPSPSAEHDFASFSNGASVAYVSSGPVMEAPAVIDEDVSSSYAFDPTDPDGCLLLDVSFPAKVHRVAAILSGHSGTLEVYALQSLPGRLADPGTEQAGKDAVSLPKGFFDDRAPVAAIPFGSGLQARSEEITATDARYFLFRWQPQDAPSSPAVHSISLFGRVAPDTAQLMYTPIFEFLEQTGQLPPPPDLPSVDEVAPIIRPTSP